MPPQEYLQIPCAHCGQPARKRARDLERYPVTYCGRACATTARRATDEPGPARGTVRLVYRYRCDVCREMFTGHTRRTRPVLCNSWRCRWLWRWHGEALWNRLTCRECGTTWLKIEQPTRREFCSASCARRNQRRTENNRRDRRIREGTRREAIDICRLAERDGWRCHLCKRKVTRQTWSIDHLIPLSAGGNHTYDNVALAHQRCNAIRGARAPAQLRLH